MKSSCSPLLSPLFRREAFLFSKFPSTTAIKVSAEMKSILVCSLILFGARRTLSRALVTNYCDPSSQGKRKRQEKTASFYVQRHVAKLVYAAAAAAVKPTWMGKLIVPRNRSRWAKLNCIWLFFSFSHKKNVLIFIKWKSCLLLVVRWENTTLDETTRMFHAKFTAPLKNGAGWGAGKQLL